MKVKFNSILFNISKAKFSNRINLGEEAINNLKNHDQKFLNKFIKHKQLLIDGKFVNSKSGKVFDNINPSTEEIICQVQQADLEDVNQAALSSKMALEKGPWSKMTAFERAKILYKLADLVDIHREELAALDALDCGKPFSIGRDSDMEIVSNILKYFAGWADKVAGKVINHSAMKNSLCYTLNEPVGVVGAIIPWNYPLAMASWKFAPCLAMGNTLVMKPAEQSPLSLLRFGELALEAGIPKGVLNIIPGFGDAGAHLASHELIDKVTFTGSTEVGYKIMRNSHTHRLKRITLELGGKSPNIILNDSDLELALEQATNAIFTNNGQNCVAGSRTFVQEGIYDEFVKNIGKHAKNQKVGNPFDDVDQGPLVDKELYNKYKKYIDLGVKEGANLITGGKTIGNKGYFVEPSVFENVKDDMSIAKDEIFGPVMSVLKFKDLDEVAQRANNTPYGLGAGIVGKDINSINYLIKKLRVGTIYVNSYNSEDVSTPFGGMKDSGIGRENGENGLSQYLEPKTVIITLH